MIMKLLNLIILLFVPFLMAGVIKKTKSFWGGRKGPSVMQPFYDFVKLLKKDFVISNTTSVIFKIAPVISLASVLFAGLFVPLASGSAVVNIAAGIIIFAYTLSLGKFVSLIAAMDTGSSFEGMGASRDKLKMIMKLLNLIILLFVPFLMAGVIKKTKSFWGGRKGPSVMQPFYDFVKLLKKDFVISNTTSVIFKIAPVISLASVLFAGLFVPLASGSAVVNIAAGIIIFAYTLSLGKFVSLIAAMDTGSSFEGMGASREACFTSIVEPAFFMIIASIMLLSGNYTFDSLKTILANAGSYGVLITIFAVVVLFIMVLIEGSRVPVDDPATHLELTMIHEVMILDNSGSDLAIYTWANGIKMLLISSLIANMIIPSGISDWLSIVLYLLIMFIISVLIGTVESGMARLRMSHVFEFIFVMSSLALVVFSLVIARMFGG